MVSPLIASEKKNLLNLVEPESFLDAFIEYPPEQFQPQKTQINGHGCYSFLFHLDLLTTADEGNKHIWHNLTQKWFPFLGQLLKLKTLFIGAPSSEYVILPKNTLPSMLKMTWLHALENSKASLLVIKDLPLESPFLSDFENEFSKLLLTYLEQEGFLIVSGQALGYVPIDFNSREDYFKKFTSNRRNNFKRKLKTFSKVSVQEIPLGSVFFTEKTIAQLYQLYLNVYNKSYIHFEKHSLDFFRRVFLDSNSGGHILLFETETRVIGFSLCYVHQNMLIEKYIGAHYPDSREYNLYYLSWFYKLDFCIRHQLQTMIVGCTDVEIKAYLGAQFTQTYHAVYIKNPMLRYIGTRAKSLFESDKHTLEKLNGN